MKFGIVSYKDEIMIKIKDDFPIEEEEDSKIITLKKDNAIAFAKEILKEAQNKNG